MDIHLPNSAFLGNIETFIQRFNPEDENTLVITSNKTWVSVHPLVLSMVASLGLNVKSKGGKITFEPMEARSKHYFERMGLFKILGIDSKITLTEHESAGRFIPISVIKNSDDITQFMTELVPLLHKEQFHATAIRHVISELVRNVLEHSGYKHGAVVCAQYFKKSNRIRIGVADNGIGIKTTIAKAYPTKDDFDAIRLALIPGITGTTAKIGGTEDNGGFGLFIVKSIAKVNRDFFLIYSGDSIYKMLRTPANKTPKLNANPLKDEHSRLIGVPRWNGTAVGIDICLDEHRNFIELLELIHGIYRKDIKKKKKIKFKKATFI